MKTEKKIFITFILNFLFSIFEFIGGIFTGSIAIISDAVHDAGDALSIGVSFFLEKKSKVKPNEKYTYGYARLSVLGGLITTAVLIIGSSIVIYNAIYRIIFPTQINYNAMIIFAIVGVAVNLFSAILTHGGLSLNQKAVNLHMLEDVLGWIVVLVGAVVMKFSNFFIIDPIMSIAIAVFILVMAIKNIIQVFEVFLEKIPNGISVQTVKKELLEIDGVLDVHHIHIWTLDGMNNYSTMHIVINSYSLQLKEMVKEELLHLGIAHSTLEFENENEHCNDKECNINIKHHHSCHHHSHHH